MGCYSKHQLQKIHARRAQRASDAAKLALWDEMVRLLESVAKTDKSNQPWLNQVLASARAVNEDQPQ